MRRRNCELSWGRTVRLPVAAARCFEDLAQRFEDMKKKKIEYSNPKSFPIET